MDYDGAYDFIIFQEGHGIDIVMPGMDYREVHREIREAGGGIGVILSSGYKLPPEATALVEEGDLRFIQKPYTLQDLAELIGKTLEDVPKRTRKK